MAPYQAIKSKAEVIHASSVMVHQYGVVLDENSSLMFYIGGEDSGQVHTWEEGGATLLNLEAY